MTNVDSDGSRSLHGIQCGIARMSMVASTGSPSRPRVSTSLTPAPTGRTRMFWLTASAMPARAHASTQSRAVANRQRKRLLRQDALDDAGPRRGQDDGRLHVRRHGHVEDFDRAVGEEGFDGVVDGRDGVPLGDGAGLGRVARGDGDGVEARLAVGDEVAVAHDEPGPDAADAEVPAARQPRQVVEGCHRERRRSYEEGSMRRSNPGSAGGDVRRTERMAADDPPSPISSVDDKCRFVRVGPAIEHPVFGDRRDREVDVDVADEIFLRIAFVQDFDHDERRHVAATSSRAAPPPAESRGRRRCRVPATSPVRRRRAGPGRGLWS